MDKDMKEEQREKGDRVRRKFGGFREGAGRKIERR